MTVVSGIIGTTYFSRWLALCCCAVIGIRGGAEVDQQKRVNKATKRKN